MITPPLDISANPTLTRKVSSSFISGSPFFRSRCSVLGVGEIVAGGPTPKTEHRTPVKTPPQEFSSLLHNGTVRTPLLAFHGTHRLSEQTDSLFDVPLVHARHGEAHVHARSSPAGRSRPPGVSDSARRRRLRHAPARDLRRQMTARRARFRPLLPTRTAPAGEPSRALRQRSAWLPRRRLGRGGPGGAGPPLAQERRDGRLQRQWRLEVRGLLHQGQPLDDGGGQAIRRP